MKKLSSSPLPKKIPNFLHSIIRAKESHQRFCPKSDEKIFKQLEDFHKRNKQEPVIVSNGVTPQISQGTISLLKKKKEVGNVPFGAVNVVLLYAEKIKETGDYVLHGFYDHSCTHTDMYCYAREIISGN